MEPNILLWTWQVGAQVAAFCALQNSNVQPNTVFENMKELMTRLLYERLELTFIPESVSIACQL